MESSQQCNIEEIIEQSFIDFWINKLEIWTKHSSLQNPLYSQERLRQLYNAVKQFRTNENINFYTSNGKLSEYWVSLRELDWKKCENLTLKLVAVVALPNVDWAYILGEYLTAVPLKMVNGTLPNSKWMELCLRDGLSYQHPENTVSGDGWYLISLVENEPNIFRTLNEKGEYL